MNRAFIIISITNHATEKMPYGNSAINLVMQF